MTDCPFCAIVAGTVPASLVAETAQAIAFLDLRQPVPGHVLVIPRQHVETIYTLEPGTAAEVMQLAVRVAKALRACFDSPGLNLWQSNGQAGGQEVPHFHLHLQPRLHRDGLLRLYPGGLPPAAARARLDDLAAQLHPYCREQR